MRETAGRTPHPAEGPAKEEAINNNFNNFTDKNQDIKQAMLRADLSIIPADPTPKKPTLSWKPFQKAPMSQDAAAGLNWPGVAIITGKASRNAEVIDFDYMAVGFNPWAEIVESESPGLTGKLTRQATQSGGKHTAWRCPGVTIPGGAKLAYDKIEVDGPGDHDFQGKSHKAQQEGNRWFIYPCFIESRGEGNYALVDPTAGYHLENGTFLDLPEITPDERQILIRAAQALNRYVKPQYHKQPTIDGTRPGDDYNQKADPRQLLEKDGWTPAGSRGDFEHWTRPGKDRGISGSLIDGKLFNCFTTNGAPLEEKVYTPFALYATLEHNGDFEAAARELRRQGYGGGSSKSSKPVFTEKGPEPLPDELLPVAPFDYDLLPESLRAWVEDIAERIQCPPDFVAVAVMAALSVLIMRKVGIRPQAKTDWTVICNVWALIVGRPGVLKSPALEAALSPLKRLIGAAMDVYQEADAAYQIEAMAAKLRKEAAEKQARKALEKNPGADLLALLAVDEVGTIPRLKRYIANDTSPASLGELLRQNPNGLLVFRDEVVSLLKSLDREGQEEGRGFYLTAWNGDSSYTFDRIGRGLNLDIPAVCLSVLGGTQPGRLSEYIGDAVKGGAADDGLIQRFGLLVWPDTAGTWKDVDRWPDTAAKNEAFKVFDRLDKLDPLQIGAKQDTDNDGEPDGLPYLRFEPAALELFLEWRMDLEKRLRGELHPALESHFAKYRKLIPSLSLIIHLADDHSGPVSERATLQALAWGEYLETHAQRAYGSVSQPEIAVSKALLRRIKKGDLPPSFSSRDVWRPGWAKLSDKDQVKAALQLLEDYGWIAVERVDTGGRPATVYHAHPEACK